MTTLIICIIILIVIGLFLFDKPRTLLKAFGNKFIEDTAKTEQGADAIYSQAIDDARENYNKSVKYLHDVAGKLQRAKSSLLEAQNAEKRTKSEIERLCKMGRFDDAEILQADLELAIEAIKTHQDAIRKLEPLNAQAEQLQRQYETNLKKLENERKLVIGKMKLNKASAEMYEGLDELATLKTTDKLLKSVRQGAEELEDRYVGASTVYNNKTSTKAANIRRELGSTETNDFMAEMRAKYGNKK